ncbi:MAG: hypothetical protein JO148_05285, partial [Acidimicrobiia bacterium]|nr:hypothetical protein [Acidimicrobiia bacterium]
DADDAGPADGLVDDVVEEAIDADSNAELEPAPPAWEPQEPVAEEPLRVPEPDPPLVDVRETVDADFAPLPEPVAEFTEIAARDVDDDTFFAQLRGALDDDAPLGPREDASGMLRWREEAATAVAEAPSLYDQGEPARRKFGRKKRRQS